MEAAEYFLAYEAMKEGENAGQSGRLMLTMRVNDPCGITKIVWSSFDFMTGPDLRFLWEVAPLEASVTPLNLSGEEGSEAPSVNSSMSATSMQFEDIDDPLQNPLLTVTENIDVDDGLFLLSSSPILSIKERAIGGGQYLDDYMTDSITDSRSTIGPNTVNSSMLESSSSGRLDESGSNSEPNSAPSSKRRGSTLTAIPDESGEKAADTQREITPDDSLLETPIESSTNDEHATRQKIFDGLAELTSRTGDEGGDDFEQNLQKRERGIDELQSCFDSGIAATISTHSDLSALCTSPVAQVNEQVLELSLMESSIFNFRKQNSRDSTEGEHSDVVLDPPDDVPSDETFVAKFVLAEQICSTQLPSNPLIVKLTCVPERSLLAVSYIFSLPAEEEENRSMHAISLLLPLKRLDWFMCRERLFENMMTDMVPRIKASLLEEEYEDSIVRLTTELTRMIGLFGSLERFPLLTEGKRHRIKLTLLNGYELKENKLLAKAISGVLQSQGYCVILGDNHNFVAKLLLTLCFFVPQELRWNCLRAYRHTYNPYVRLQAVRRIELPTIILHGARCEWPVCIVDVDRNKVCLSAPFQKHRLLKAKIETYFVNSILQQNVPKAKNNVKLELQPVKTIENVRWLLRNLDLLPQEESARLGLVEQFMLYFENLAQAFVKYVRAASDPLNDEKECGVRSSRFSLTDCRKALDLTQDNFFNAVLARAELLQPQIADFIFQ
ncbi:unnamed protein product, partial [Mesorhabditis belari]|uniref:Uncharacterized protein n=1 Tax=Mesorhabditis belari TaxID=2138241 RepID=A0AAF3EWR1_9BILA